MKAADKSHGDRPARFVALPFGRVLLAALGLAFSCTAISLFAETNENAGLPREFVELIPLHEKLGKPGPDDWLANHRETGQTYQQYLRIHPIRANKQRRVIYVQPLGAFNSTEEKILDSVVDYLGLYFQLPTIVRETLSLDLVPATARRRTSDGDSEQILTTYVLKDVLKPRLPKDAVALIALTNADLWPGAGWNFVFGQASFVDRVGVWSIHRYGDPGTGEAAFQRCLVRALKTASHEMGHMFSMSHCTFYECNMCGSNNLQEADRRPLEPCPVCLAKLCHATGAKPVERFQALSTFYVSHGMTHEKNLCEKSLSILTKTSHTEE